MLKISKTKVTRFYRGVITFPFNKIIQHLLQFDHLYVRRTVSPRLIAPAQVPLISMFIIISPLKSAPWPQHYFTPAAVINSDNNAQYYT